MWQIVYLSQSQEEVQKVISLLNNNKILTKINKKNDNDIEILVPSTELAEAQELILSN